MPDAGYLIVAVATAVAVTWPAGPALRRARRLRSSPLVSYLNTVMPVGVMVILAVYTLRTFNQNVPDQAWPTMLALAVTVVLHLWRRNILLSIVGGTAVHVAVASTLFAH